MILLIIKCSRLPKLKIVQGYGMSEGNTLTSEVWCTKGHKANSVGKVSPGNILKVTGEEMGKLWRNE